MDAEGVDGLAALGVLEFSREAGAPILASTSTCTTSKFKRIKILINATYAGEYPDGIREWLLWSYFLFWRGLQTNSLSEMIL